MKITAYMVNRIALASVLVILGCGGRRHESGGVVATTETERAFVSAANENHIPVRIMMAAAYLESGLRFDRSSVGYQLDGRQVTLSPAKGESAFGFTLAELGITDPAHATLPEQIAAYGKYVGAKVAGSGLSPSAVTAEEKMRWIWRLASIHRGESGKRNLLAVFSREMMKVLNAGYTVQDSEGTVARLDKEAQPLREDDLPENFKQDLTLDMYHADIRSAYMFSLVRDNPSEVVNHPKRIEVIHCPFTLSACIHLQETAATDQAPMMAHYIVPASDEAVPGVLQFNHHDEIVSTIAADGHVETVQDRVVVMLAGSSGRYLDGQRKYADPMWLTDFQLRLLGVAVSEICASIARSESINREECQNPGGANGVLFRTQPGELYRWGDIPDFDETIVTPYLKNVDGISANTTLSLTPETPLNAGTPFRLNAGFQATTRRVELERLVRCPAPDRRVVWEPIDQQQIRNVSSYSFGDNSWYDAGPNGTGDQFFRVKAVGEAGKFLGWSTKRVQLRGFEKDVVPEAPSKYCLRNGT